MEVSESFPPHEEMFHGTSVHGEETGLQESVPVAICVESQIKEL